MTAGAPLSAARAAAVLVHGRGATAEGIVRLAESTVYRHGLALVAPRAARSRWYPHAFTAPVERNEPWLSSGLRAVGDAVETATASVPAERVLLFGFSQGACLASEFLAREPRRVGGLAALSGGLVGPTVDDTRYDRGGDRPLAGVPVFLGCDRADPHVSSERVGETAATFRRLGGEVTERLYDDLGHAVGDDEVAHVSTMVEDLLVEGAA